MAFTADPSSKTKDVSSIWSNGVECYDPYAISARALTKPAANPIAVLWGGGGTSIYNINSGNVFIYQMDQPTAAKVAALDLKQFTTLWGSSNAGTGTTVIIDPGPDDRLVVNGKTLGASTNQRVDGVNGSSPVYTDANGLIYSVTVGTYNGKDADKAFNYHANVLGIADRAAEAAFEATQEAQAAAASAANQSAPGYHGDNILDLCPDPPFLLSIQNFVDGDFGITTPSGAREYQTETGNNIGGRNAAGRYRWNPKYDGPWSVTTPASPGAATLDRQTDQRMDPIFAADNTTHPTITAASANGDQLSSPKTGGGTGWGSSLQSEGFNVSFNIDVNQGSVQIDNHGDTNAGNTGTIRFADAVAPADITLTGNKAGDLVLADVGANTTVTVAAGLADISNAVGQVSFADGTTWTREDIVTSLAAGSPTRTSIYGDDSANVLDSAGYATYAQGNGGADTFIYNAGYGMLEINEFSPGLSTTATLKLGPDITAAQISLTGDASGALLLTDGITGDEVRIDHELTAADHGVAAVAFDDGTVWTEAQMVAQLSTGTPTMGSLYGDDGANVLDSAGYATYAQGNGGADTFIFNAGYGALSINEDNGAAASTAVLQFGPGITASQIGVSGDAAGNLLLTDGTPGDLITLDHARDSARFGISQALFSDGTSLTAAQIIAQSMVGSPMNTMLYGTAGDDSFDSGGYAFYAQGNGGADTFVYDAGYGALEINALNVTGLPISVLLGPGITADQTNVTSDQAGNIILTDGINGDQVTIDRQLTDVHAGLLQIQFADGRVWAAGDLLATLQTASPSRSRIYGDSGPNVLDASGYATYAQGNGGADTFIYAPGQGELEIYEANSQDGASAVLQFGPGATAAQIGVSSDWTGSLTLTDGIDGDRIRLDSMMDGPAGSLGVALITFADGTSLTAQQLFALATIGSPDNTYLHGTAGADNFDGGGYASIAEGDGGADRFQYSAGYGAFEIRENNNGDPSAATLEFGSGIAAADITATADDLGNLILTDGQPGDRIQVDSQLNGSGAASPFGIATVSFADGTTLTAQQLIAMAEIGTPTNTRLFGTVDAEIFDSRGFAVSIQGNGGADTFLYNAGYGALEINEYAGWGTPTTATLKIGTGITQAQMGVATDPYNVYLSFGGGTDVVTLDNMLWTSFGVNARGIGSIQFADGTTLSAQDLMTMASNGSESLTMTGWNEQGRVLDGGNLTVNGYANTVWIGNNGTVTLGGSENTLNAGDGCTVTANGYGNTINIGRDSTIHVTGGVQTFQQDVTTTGTILIDGDTVVDFAGSVGDGQRISFLQPLGTLVLDSPDLFAATISGLTAGAAIDLPSMGYDETFSLSFTGDATSGTLAFSDSSQAGAIALMGSYAASEFQAAADGRGGTVLTYSG